MSAPVIPPTATNHRHSILRVSAAALLALLLAGCAQQRSEGYYSVASDSTLSDAERQAQGRSTRRAPSQIQLGFGNTQKPEKAAAPTSAEAADKAKIAATVRPLVEAKTFLGTLPCQPGNQACSASRVTLTLAPSGEWRSRTLILGTASDGKNNIAEQGCWDVVGTEPWRILLRTKSNAPKASLTFVNDNLLRVNSVNDVKPLLDYHLTRQSEVDGIAEMNKAPALKCES